MNYNIGINTSAANPYNIADSSVLFRFSAFLEEETLKVALNVDMTPLLSVS